MKRGRNSDKKIEPYILNFIKRGEKGNGSASRSWFRQLIYKKKKKGRRPSLKANTGTGEKEECFLQIKVEEAAECFVPRKQGGIIRRGKERAGQCFSTGDTRKKERRKGGHDFHNLQ